ncbi:MAG: choice-of-anchor D domain-containing protein [Candidatus Sulfobium sp.]|jgi:PKD repeat protein
MMVKTALLAYALFPVLLAGLMPVNALGYVACKTGGGLDIKWSTPNVNYMVNEAGGPVGGSLAALQAGMQTWTDVGSSIFVFSYGGATSKTAADCGTNDGVNMIAFGPMGTGDGILAQNTYWYTNGGGILDSDIQVNTSYSWSAAGAAGYYDIQNVVTHEMGHTLCLADLYNSSDAEKTMYGYAAKGETKKRTLDPDDISGISYLYPAPNIVVTPASLAFGSVDVGNALQQDITVTNNGAANLVLGTVIGPSAPFSLVSDSCSGKTVAPATGSCAVTLRFEPAAATVYSGNLNIPSNDPDQNPATVGLSGTGVMTTYTLSVSRGGTGSGTVTSTPGGIDCGPTCSAAYIQGAGVTLGAVPGADSTFAGWQGAGCSGTGSCGVTMTGDMIVTATFNMIRPTADFSAVTTTGQAPLYVSFTDTSTHSPSQWTWDFGDGGISTLENPSYTYTTAGTYTVSLTVANDGGSDLVTKTGLITVSTCSNSSVRLMSGASTVDYADLATAVGDAVVAGDVIEAQAVSFTGDLIFDKGVEVTLNGGYGCDYQANPSATTVTGSLAVTSGTLTVEGVSIQ